CVVQSQCLSRHLFCFSERFLGSAIPPHCQRYIGLRLGSVCKSEVGINFERAIKMGDGTVQRFFAPLFEEKPPSQIFPISFRIYLPRVCGSTLVLRCELCLHSV